ncbi:MAG: hypothetical protein VB996_18945 [Pseudomonadales bacterium]
MPAKLGHFPVHPFCGRHYLAVAMNQVLLAREEAFGRGQLDE